MTDIRRSPGLTAPAKTRFRLPWTLLLIVALLAGAGYLLQVQWRHQAADQQAALQVLREQVLRLQSARDTQTAELAAIRRDQAALQSRFESFSGSLTPGQHREWLANETAYYLDLAEQHLQLQQDAEPALRLVELADSLLAAEADPGLTQLRQGLAEDRLALLAARQIDRAGLSLRLDALKQQTLGLVLPMHAGPAQRSRVNPAAAPHSGSPWEQGWRAFRDLITIRRYDAPVRPLLSDDQRWLVRQSVYLELTQAQLALWRNQQDRYRQSLEDVRLLVRDYAPADPAFAALQEELVRLQAQTLPPIPLTLPHARQALAALKSLHPVTAGQP